MGAHWISVIPIHLEPLPNPKVSEKPTLLPGLWLESINDIFGVVAKQMPPDPTIRDLSGAIVLDYPAYVRGLLNRLQLTEDKPVALLNLLSQRHNDIPDCYAEHPLEVDVQEEDIRKLVMMSCILAGARVVVVNRPVLAEMKGAPGSTIPVFDRSYNTRHVWRKPRNPVEDAVFDPDAYFAARLDMVAVREYCELLERYFRPTNWHSGRVAVAVGAFLSYVLGADSGQGYLALTTVFEALLSTDKTEITHQISERVAFMLESTEDGRYALYVRMKKLYDTRSRLVHGDIENKRGVITLDRLRLDAKMTVVPDQDYLDIFDLCLCLFRRVLKDDTLLALLERKDSSKALNEYYLRLGFRG